MLLAPPLLLLVVCLLGLPAPSEESVKMAGFNVQVFGETKSEKREVMKILGKVGVLTMLVC